MGFGLLIFGYFLTFAFSLARVYFFADVAGILLMLVAFSRLSEYNRYFRGAVWAGMACTLAILANVLCMTLQLITRQDILDMILDVAKTGTAFCMHIFMLLGCRGIALGAEAKGLAEKAQRNLVMSCMYYAMYFLVLATSSLYPHYVTYVSFMVTVYWFVVFFFNLTLIYTCFGMLYPAEGDTMVTKRSRFAFVNKVNDAFDKLDEKNNRYRRESMEMALAEAEKVHQKKTGKKKKKTEKRKKH